MANSEHTTRQFDFSSGQAIAIGATSARSTAIPFEEVLVTASIACYISVGGSTVTAANNGNSMALAANEKIFLRIPMNSYIAVLQASAAGTLRILPVQL